MKKKIEANKFIVVTGLSGAGKALTMRCFEDLGFFCVDNLPTLLIPQFAQLIARQGQSKNMRVVLMVDVRERSYFDNLFTSLNSLDKMGFEYEILFLEASDEVLVRRYKETRRPHPLHYGTILEDIKAERKKLEKIRNRADIIVDTSNFTSQELKEFLIKTYLRISSKREMVVSLISFGYKYGIPQEADLVFDVRFLPNPHYLKSLEPYTGIQKKVRDYVLRWQITKQFIDRFFSFLKFLIPQYVKEGKSYLTIALGCTGGRHRSVVLVEELKKFFKSIKHKVVVKHRDLDRR